MKSLLARLHGFFAARSLSPQAAEVMARVKFPCC